MQGHDVLFDVKNKRIGIAESDCDYNYLISGKKSVDYDAFNVGRDVVAFYFHSMCMSKHCRNHAVVALWTSHVFLIAMYYCMVRWKKKKNEKNKRMMKWTTMNRNSGWYSIRPKDSEDMEATVSF